MIFLIQIGEGTRSISDFLPKTSNKVNINCKDGGGNTPLHIAASQGFENIAKLLLDKHADFNIKNNQLLTPLHLAIFNGMFQFFCC